MAFFVCVLRLSMCASIVQDFLGKKEAAYMNIAYSRVDGRKERRKRQMREGWKRRRFGRIKGSKTRVGYRTQRLDEYPDLSALETGFG